MLERLARLPSKTLVLPGRPGVEVRVASGFRARLRGLAGHSVLPQPGLAVLLPRTRSVHTFGMAFPIDLIWLDRRGEPIRIDRTVPPRRIVICPRATAVIELPGTSVDEGAPDPPPVP